MLRIPGEIASLYRERASVGDRSLSAEIRMALKRDLARLRDGEPTTFTEVKP
jgi:hypothetical protein